MYLEQHAAEFIAYLMYIDMVSAKMRKTTEQIVSYETGKT